MTSYGARKSATLASGQAVRPLTAQAAPWCAAPCVHMVIPARSTTAWAITIRTIKTILATLAQGRTSLLSPPRRHRRHLHPHRPVLHQPRRGPFRCSHGSSLCSSRWWRLDVAFTPACIKPVRSWWYVSAKLRRKPSLLHLPSLLQMKRRGCKKKIG